jgi:hypothetical protein
MLGKKINLFQVPLKAILVPLKAILAITAVTARSKHKHYKFNPACPFVQDAFAQNVYPCYFFISIKCHPQNHAYCILLFIHINQLMFAQILDFWAGHPNISRSTGSLSLATLKFKFPSSVFFLSVW